MAHDPDGYLRISAGRAHPIRDTLAPGSELGLLFIDLAGDDVEPQYVSRAIQNSPLARVRFMLFRWPQLGAFAPDSPERNDNDESVRNWLASVSSHASLALFAARHIGVVRFNVGEPPTVFWHDSSPPDELTERNLLDRALRVEFRALLDWGHGVWRPKNYHYALPSGTHSDVFIKLSDAFRTPQDVRVMATWLVDRLSDEMTIIADTADLIPLTIYLTNLARDRGWRTIDSEVLDEYPRTRADLAIALRAGRKSTKALLLLSVNASGTYRDIMCDTARTTYRSATEWSMVVLVDKTLPAERTGFHAGDSEEITTWYGLELPPRESPHYPTDCILCADADRAQVVMIDPRTFEAVALPGANLMMPDTSAARGTRNFWTACSEAGCVEVLSRPAESPSTAAREKDGLMNLKVEVRKLWQSGGFLSALAAQLRTLPTDKADLQQSDCIVVSAFDHALPQFAAAVRLIQNHFEIEHSIPIIEVGQLGGPLDQLGQYRTPLILSAGSVTGWNLRQLLISVQESWETNPTPGNPSCLVVHARPATLRQWENVSSSFEGRMVTVWKSLIPETSPLREEADLLAEVAPDSLTPAAAQYLDDRLKICNPPSSLDWDTRVTLIDGGDPDPRAVLWGLGSDSEQRVRNESLYGTRVDAITAYAAVGSAMQSSRQQSERTDPRLPMFDFDSIARSYYDGIIVANILRWARPSETWWGTADRDQRGSITALVKRTTMLSDQTVLFPELLLAAAQGKIPRVAVQDMANHIATMAADWPEEINRGPIELGFALLDTQLINRPG